jgi:hypothetical protein
MPKLNTSTKIWPVVIVALLLLLISVFILRDIFFQPGRLFVRDFIFPSSPNFPLGVWNWFTSTPNLELNKIPVNLFFTVGYSLLGSSLFINSFQLLTLFLVGFIPFVIIYFVLLKNISISPKRAAVVAIVPALIYLLNPWVLDRINNHIFMVLGMAFLPLLFFLCYRAFDDKFSWQKSLLAGACLAFVSLLSSHNIFYWAPLVMLLAILLLIFNRENRWHTIRSMVVSGATFLLLSAFWILPLLSTSKSSAVQPSYNLTYSSIEKLSVSNTPLDVFGLIGGGAWRNILMIPPIGAGASISFGLFGLVMAMIGLYYYPNRKLVVIASFFLVTLLLFSMGTNAPIPVYKWLFASPLQPMIWLYRDPSRFIQFLLLPIIILATFAVYRLLVIIDNLKYRRGVMGIGLAGIALVLFASPAAYSLATKGGGTLVGSEPPSDYQKVGEILKNDGSKGKILWLPVRGYYFYTWNKASDVAGDFYTASSPIPTYSLNTSAGVAAKMNQFIYQQIMRGNRSTNLGNILAKINVQYAAVHTDLSGWQGKESARVAETLQKQQDLKMIYKSDNYQIFKNLAYGDANLYSIDSHGLHAGDIKHLSTIDEKGLPLRDPSSWRPNNKNAKQDGSYQWQMRFDQKTNQHSVTYEFRDKHENFAPYDTLEFSVLPDSNNTGTELSIVIQTGQGNFTFNRYELRLGEWNTIPLNLRAADEISTSQGALFDLNSVERIIFTTYGKTTFGHYYQNGKNKLTFKDLRLRFDNTYGNYDPQAVIAMFNRVGSKQVAYSKRGNTYEISNADSLGRDQALVLGESFDSSWRLIARKDDKTYSVKPHLMYGVINAFPLGDIPYGSKLYVAYNTEGAHKVGSTISLVSLSCCSGYLVFAFSRSHRKVWRLYR